mmetsp:Transcript_49760/g.133657  ORF Transcript_49760/g.133657 Transcript_49760/m.133657 type:complete len:232 (-) Transcript_49760:56-751(-)
MYITISVKLKNERLPKAAHVIFDRIAHTRAVVSPARLRRRERSNTKALGTKGWCQRSKARGSHSAREEALLVPIRVGRQLLEGGAEAGALDLHPEVAVHLVTLEFVLDLRLPPFTGLHEDARQDVRLRTLLIEGELAVDAPHHGVPAALSDPIANDIISQRTLLLRVAAVQTRLAGFEHCLRIKKELLILGVDGLYVLPAIGFLGAASATHCERLPPPKPQFPVLLKKQKR